LNKDLSLLSFRYLPQIALNFSRKSVRGFSATGIIIKHVGASFLFVNSLFIGEVLAVVLYGLCNVVQHSMFMCQFSIYSNVEFTPLDELRIQKSSGNGEYIHTEKSFKEKYLLWLLFPLLPVFLGLIFPSSMYITNSIKPITQVLSHLPQLNVCYQLKTTSGVSLTSQHLNIIGGFAGLYMCSIIPPVSWATYLIYANSVLQALSLYAMAGYYDGFCVHKYNRRPSQ